MADDRHPVVVGVGQVTLRAQQWPDIAGPVDLMAEAAGRAATDAGAPLLGAVDQVTTVHPFSWDHGDTPALLSGRLGLDERAERRHLGIGGHTPQRAVNELAERLARGEIEVALLAGGEALAGKQRARRAGHRVEWERHDEPLPKPEARDPNHPVEHAHDLSLPIYSFPMWEPALRASAGRTPDEHRRFIGRLMARMTEVAATNRHAWFDEARSAEDLMAVTPDNRMVSTPYPKRVNAHIRVDQGAALLLTTAGTARRLGVPADRWVWILGGGDGEDVWYLTERTGYDRSPAIERVAGQVWASSGMAVDDVGLLDLYSCFPSAVQLAMRAYGVADDDPRPMTVTGGLPYAGGPGNDYATHSVATMVERLRAEPGGVGLCTGVGWHATRHSAGLYGSREPARRYERVDPGPDHEAVLAEDHPVVEPDPTGPATVDAYSVSFDRDGKPEVARVLARLDPGRRTAVAGHDPEVAAALAEGEWHGATVQTHPDLTFTL